MYIKFLIGSIIFALVCFGIGYRVCWLRMDKKVRSYMKLNKMLERNYQILLGELVERRFDVGENGLPHHPPGWFAMTTGRMMGDE